ncbi:unnamed protein product [Rotaria sp. Silwood1]|nr:unnamed protein product [Rotaria sp. Silwood1]
MIPEEISSLLGVLDSTARKVRGNRPRPNGEWLLRVDTSRHRAEFNHININPRLTNVPDPHVQIPQSVVTISKEVAKTAKFMEKVNKVALPVAMALDTIRFSCAIYDDSKRGDKKQKQTKLTVTSIVGGWIDGVAGTYAGTEVSEVIGGHVGALFGGVGAIPEYFTLNMELKLVVSSKHWIIKPCFSKTVYEPALVNTWENTMKDILILHLVHHPMLLIAPHPLTSLEGVLSNAETIKFHNNIEYSIIVLHPGNVHDKELLITAMDSIEFECAGLWFVVYNQPLPISTDFILKTLKLIRESNHFISLSDIDVELLACVADGQELLWLNPGSEISINEILYLLKLHKWEVSMEGTIEQ